MAKKLSEHLMEVFSEQGSYEAFRNLSRDIVNNIELFDETGSRISKSDANEVLRATSLKILGLVPGFTKRELRRGLKNHGEEFFEMIEDEIDLRVEAGLLASEFFNEYVDNRNVARGDGIQFNVEDDTILVVEKVSGDHHDLIMQRLGQGEYYTIQTSAYAIKVGDDIEKFLMGYADWNRLIDACAAAFLREVQTSIYGAFVGATAELPSVFKGTGALSTTTKTQFDEVIENVSTANGNVPVIILGTQAALRKINALADVDWISASQKEEVAAMGRLGSYEGVALIEIPQRFKSKTDFTKLIDNNQLFIMPNTTDRFIKFVDDGETEVLEYTDKGDYMDDSRSYEVQRRMGVGIQLGRYFGNWQFT